LVLEVNYLSNPTLPLISNEHINEEIIKYINETDITADVNISYQIILSTFTFDVEPTSKKYKEIETFLKFIIYEKFGEEIEIEKQNETDQMIEQTKRKYQEIFRKNIIQKYKTCIITRDGELVCEACHIIPYCEATLQQKYDIHNGLLLSASIHKLFDLYLLTINPQTKYVVIKNKIMRDIKYKRYWEYNGMKVDVLDSGTCMYLKNHFEIFNKI